MGRSALLVALGLLCGTGPAFAAVPAAVAPDVMLVCQETGTVGFRWDEQGNVDNGLFQVETFTVRILSEGEREIQWGGMPSILYQCTPEPGGLHCHETDGAQDFPIIFGKDGFTRAFLDGPPTGGDPNIYISYGTCINK